MYDQLPQGMDDIEHGVIEREYPHLGLWELGEQLVAGGEVYMRKYSIPMLDEAEDSEVEEVTVPQHGEVYKLRTLIPIINLCSYRPFTKWTRSKDWVRVTELRSKALSSTVSIYRPTLEEISPPPLTKEEREEGVPERVPALDRGPTVTLSTGQAIAWGPSRELISEPTLTFDLEYGQHLQVQLYGETVLEVSHSPGPRGKDEDDDVLVQSPGIWMPPGYEVPTDFPNDPTRERVMVKKLVGRARGWG
jgi:hypothetical protein